MAGGVPWCRNQSDAAVVEYIGITVDELKVYCPLNALPDQKRDRPKKSNLDEDFPIRLQKPIDTPYGPYADGFPAEQHLLGPFGPIRAKIKKLAVESQTTHAGEPDNGSYASGAER